MAKKPIMIVAKLPELEQATFFTTLDNWYKANEAAAAASAAEKLAREALTPYFASATEGTNTIELGFGKQLKVECRINRTIDPAQLSALQDFAKDEADQSPEAIALRAQTKALLEELIRYKPDLSVTAFKALDADQKKIVGDLVTEKLGSYGVSIHTPKA